MWICRFETSYIKHTGENTDTKVAQILPSLYVNSYTIGEKEYMDSSGS